MENEVKALEKVMKFFKLKNYKLLKFIQIQQQIRIIKVNEKFNDPKHEKFLKKCFKV